MRCQDEIKVHVNVQIRTNHLQNMGQRKEMENCIFILFFKKALWKFEWEGAGMGKPMADSC